MIWVQENVAMIQIDLQPDTEARLAGEAQACGVELHKYIEGILEQVIMTRTPPPRRRTREEMQAFFEGITANSDQIPQLPDEAFTRESFYQDHD